MEFNNKSIPKVSIITIVYNGEKHLQQTIDSVRDQSYSNLEYLVIDGGSTDGTISIIKQNLDVISSYISEPDKGISDAFNKGIRLSTGDYIGIINADDWYENDAISHILKSPKSADLIYGKINYWLYDEIINVKNGNHETLLGGWRGMTLPHPSMFIKKKVYDQLGGYSIDYKNAMDYHFLLRAANSGFSFYNTNEIISNFRSGGVTSNQRSNSLIEERNAKQEVLKMSKIKSNLQYYFKVFALKILGPIVHKLNLNRLR